MGQKHKEVIRAKSSDYSLGPPWSFQGSALYQLHLVKAEVARAFIPKELKLVEVFGYTLGGFFLAHYDDSPASKFDELVVIAGTVWNPPTSCAWAARVLVNSQEACVHGKKEIGLPSHVGIFTKNSTEERKRGVNLFSSFRDKIGINSESYGVKVCTEIQVSENEESNVRSLCNICIPFALPTLEANENWMGPSIRMSLPSFSGRTLDIPCLLKYSCHMEGRVRMVKPAKITRGFDVDEKSTGMESENDEDKKWNHSVSVLLAKPILALEFRQLRMQVEGPTTLKEN